MTERLCAWSERDLDERGKPTPEYIRVYEEWGKGQMGCVRISLPNRQLDSFIHSILVLGNIPVDRRYPVAERDAIIDPLAPWDPVEAFKPTIAAAKAHGALVLGQIVHAGRVSGSGFTASQVPLTRSTANADSHRSNTGFPV
jgi:2,4-dienoyl-CoA reductase-like NADH-dependent reductase (Old Yellow Enzyme family)